MSEMTALFIGRNGAIGAAACRLAVERRIELLVIDESTDVQTFAKEVRWNELYRRLA